MDISTGTLKDSVNNDKFLVWLCSSGLKGEAESLMTAAQDQALNTCYHHRNIVKQPVDNKCKLRCKAEQHINYIAAGCITLVPSEYLIETIRWLVTATGWYVNVWGCTLLTSAMNTCLKGS
jgi:hypothetical protein